MLKIIYALMLWMMQVQDPAVLQQKAKDENKNIVVYFCGSDWCTICHQFKARILNEPMIDTLIQKEFVYYVADFPQRKKLPAKEVKMNEYLAERFNQEGAFPKLAIVDADFKLKAVVPNDASIETAYSILQKNIK